ncbi:uncharacterized protein LOC124885857 [Capsicum annuum]|uniref:uncharacterized protein LOC124885857 n=1 Tax=Capsicum annuum TaxID=4072 RepID=UPI001FB18C92|nr:uncharacterized protein LOC124885857 [Capsicum annuum]
MTSSKIQKDIVSACAQETVKSIIDDLDGDFLGILVDESIDISHHEQMIVALSYVNKKGKVNERVIAIVRVGDTSAKTLKEIICSLLMRHSLSASKIRGQGYDGASNMQGEINGLKALILHETPSAYCIHCFAHQLQLALVAVAKNYLLILVMSNDLSTSLQRKEQDIVNAMTFLDITLKRLQLLRDDGWDSLMNEVHNPANAFANFDKKKIMILAKHYPDEFGESKFREFSYQLDTFIIHMRRGDPIFSNLTGIGDLAEALVNANLVETYFLVYLLVKLTLILSVTTAIIESFFIYEAYQE